MPVDDKIRDRAADLVTRLQPRHVEVFFLLFLLVGVTYQVVRGVGYPRLAGQFPVVVGVPTVGMVLYLLGRRLSRSADRQGELSAAAIEARLKLAEGVFWVLLLFVFVVALGLTIGCTAFLLLYYRYKRGLEWPRLAAYVGLFLVFVIVVFQIVLQIPLYEGVLGIPQTLPI